MLTKHCYVHVKWGCFYSKWWIWSSVDGTKRQLWRLTAELWRQGMYKSGSYSLQCLNKEYYERQCSGEGKRKIQIRRQISGGCQQEDVVPVLTRWCNNACLKSQFVWLCCPRWRMGKDSTQSQTSGGCQQEAALDVEWREETRDSFFFVLKYLFKVDYHELPCSPSSPGKQNFHFSKLKVFCRQIIKSLIRLGSSFCLITFLLLIRSAPLLWTIIRH